MSDTAIAALALLYLLMGCIPQLIERRPYIDMYVEGEFSPTLTLLANALMWPSCALLLLLHGPKRGDD